MRLQRVVSFTIAASLLVAAIVFAQEKTAKSELKPPAVELRLSGPGAVDEGTIKKGQPVSLDLYFSNDQDRRGFSMGFKLFSKDIKNIVHLQDSGNGLNKGGDVKGFNGFEDKSVFDLGGVWVSERSWDGTLPDTVGFGGVTVRGFYEPHDMMRVLSLNVKVMEPGTLMVDSTFFPPGGYWKYGNDDKAAWGGPYLFRVVD
ncbi:MAG: hypothetical protein RBT76_13010 [candidate division Zixibacteria bacterium]|jgi:hypothetical protein|nr:hypothetical protein [candidate division Zixibacteria bacterium]